VENSSASRLGEVVLPHQDLECSPAIAARLCAFMRDLIIFAPARRSFTPPAVRARRFIRTPRPENPQIEKHRIFA